MDSMMEFPKTPLEFVESYKFKDSDEIYTNGSELIQVFRVKQMLEHYYEPLKENVTPKKPIDIEDGFGDDVHLCCPNCKKPIVNVWSSAKYMPNYCHYCGQSLDWSEDTKIL